MPRKLTSPRSSEPPSHLPMRSSPCADRRSHSPKRKMGSRDFTSLTSTSLTSTPLAPTSLTSAGSPSTTTKTASLSGKILRYTGSAYLRQRLVLSTISSIPITVADIRLDDSDPGLRDYEVNLLQLIQTISDGSKVKIDETGTRLTYFPGVITCGARPSGEAGADVTPVFHTNVSRGLTYYLECLLMLAPFAKRHFSIRLTGVTNGSHPDASIDTFRTVTLPFLSRVGIAEGLMLEVVRRGLAPVGGGEVLFECPQLRSVKPFEVMRGGRVKRVRGVAFTHGVSQQFAVRSIDKARGVLNDFIPDVWIYTDSSSTKKKKLLDTPKNIKGAEGYGLSLVAETMKGCYKGVDACYDRPLQDLVNHIEATQQTRSHFRGTGADDVPFHLLNDPQIDGYRYRYAENLTFTLPPKPTTTEGTLESDKDNQNEEIGNELALNGQVFEKFTVAEKLGYLTAARLLGEISLEGVVDSHHQYLPLYFMALAEQFKPSKVRCEERWTTKNIFLPCSLFASVCLCFSGRVRPLYTVHHSVAASH
eukprot:GHVN01081797.1.p1 GENE.GHVN01081797.1~~GHVN01081797.1.p1  ORF type:complete len:533 (+),score=89.32 GHVN01081797.1:349-1947(+)